MLAVTPASMRKWNMLAGWVGWQKASPFSAGHPLPTVSPFSTGTDPLHKSVPICSLAGTIISSALSGQNDDPSARSLRDRIFCMCAIEFFAHARSNILHFAPALPCRASLPLIKTALVNQLLLFFALLGQSTTVHCSSQSTCRPLLTP